uniref:Uncharacterized protein n=1 Tax=Romanomermis culicivorax TaxID=13658 RepID=A0A915JX35_ROMCU
MIHLSEAFYMFQRKRGQRYLKIFRHPEDRKNTSVARSAEKIHVFDHFCSKIGIFPAKSIERLVPEHFLLVSVLNKECTSGEEIQSAEVEGTIPIFAQEKSFLTKDQSPYNYRCIMKETDSPKLFLPLTFSPNKESYK